MYLTELTLWDDIAARLMPRDAYGWHKVIWRFFPNQETRDFLYRVDESPSGLRIYILSSMAPVPPVALPDRAVRVREIPESFLAHKRYRFQMRVNPTKRIDTDARTGQKKEKGMRVPLTQLADLTAWLARKGVQSGFSVPCLDRWPSEDCPLSIVQEGRRSFRKPQLAPAHHASVQFSGILDVTDATLFRQAFEHGIGSAKSFGFGLLMLQPIA